MIEPTPITRQESFLGVKIVMTGPTEQARAIGSGFLWKRAEKYYLITNLHNLTGWNWQTNTAMSGLGWLPESISVFLSVITEKTEQWYKYVFTPLNGSLFDECGSPAWLVHPKFREQIDVAALSLGSEDSFLSLISGAQSLASKVANEGNWTNFAPWAGDDAVVLGYPKGMHGGSGFPVWKRASIASEPHFDIDGLPKILIDTATREGMSGSLVIALRRGFAVPDGGSWEDGFFGESMKPLGVYSGRVGDDEMGVQLGVVWKIALVDEIIDGGVKGRKPHEIEALDI